MNRQFIQLQGHLVRLYHVSRVDKNDLQRTLSLSMLSGQLLLLSYSNSPSGLASLSSDFNRLCEALGVTNDDS